MIENIIAGAVGGFAKSLLEQNGKVVLPRVEEGDGGVKYVHFGFIVNIVLGAIAGFFSPDPVTALEAGMALTFVGEKIVERAPLDG